ncbi:MAG: hypothetical protein JWN48_2272 [Myxococcaceae bacterium]|nr:hypothetical protein [Myxococcaceae bacterium]
MSKQQNLASGSILTTLDDSALDAVTGAGLLTGNNSFALIDLSNLLGLGNVGVLGTSTSSTTTTTTQAPAGLLGLGGFLGVL